MSIEVVVEENNLLEDCISYKKYKAILRVKGLDHLNIKWIFSEQGIGNLIGKRSDYVLNRIKKNFEGQWIYACNAFFFAKLENAEKAKEWLESLILVHNLSKT
jgi:hypothetical protein